MNIGLDAKRAFNNSTGLGNYSRTLIQSLTHQYPDNKYFLFTPSISPSYGDLKFPSSEIIRPKSLPSVLLKSFWRSKGIIKDMRKCGLDVYHGLSHELPIGIKETGIKSVVTIHDLIHEKFPSQYPLADRKIYSQKFKYSCRNADKIIAISSQTKNDIVELYQVDPDKIEVIYQSVNRVFLKRANESEKKDVKTKFALPDRFLLSVGSIIERKNLLNVCRALPKISDQEIKIVVIGSGKDYYKKVKKWIKENKLENRFLFLNEKYAISENELRTIYQLSSGLIYISTYEGFGLPVLEGLASGIPVLTSNVSCLPEAGGVAAFYVDPLNVGEIKNAINLILENKTVIEDKMQKAELHLEKFAQEKITQQVMELYKKLED